MPAAFVSLSDAEQRFPALLLDTSVLISAYKAEAQATGGAPLPLRIPLRTSVVCLYEFIRGTAGALLPHEQRRARRAWLDDRRIARVLLSEPASRHFESLVHTTGCPPGLADALIAVACVSTGLPLLTENRADFERVDGLVLVEG